jgi:ankyrin repeat protein
MQVDAWFKAVSQGKLETLTLLLEDGVGVDVVNPSIHSRTALHVAIDLGASASVIKFLLDEGADVNARDDRGISPLQFASAVGNLPIVEMLLDRGAHVNVCDNFGFSPLHSAVFFGRLHVIDKLVAVGANVLAATKSGATPLSLAELSGNFVLVGKLRSNQKKIEGEEMLIASFGS